MDKFWRCQGPRWGSPPSLGVLLLDLHPNNLQPCSALNKPQRRALKGHMMPAKTD